MAIVSGDFEQFKGVSLHSTARLGLMACLGLLLGTGPSCDESFGATPSEPVQELASAADRPTESAMGMVRSEAEAVATEQAPTLANQLRPSTDPQSLRDVIAPTSVEATAIPSELEPIEVRIARQGLRVRIAPDHRAPLRARIPMGEAFEVFELVEGKGCAGKGWAHVGNGGYVCLANTRRGTKAPRTMPPLEDDGVLPFYFAQIPKGESARRWSSLASYLRGDEPKMITAPGRDFAFTSRRMVDGVSLFVDRQGRVMPERDLDRYRPSSFSGHDFVAAPVPAGQQLAWAVAWPETPVYASPDTTSEVRDMLGYHAEIFVEPTVIDNASGRFVALADGGYVRTTEIRRAKPVAALTEEVAADEIWIDVDLHQQVLTVLRGETPIYATLISSGRKGPTPRGVFRINKKEAYGSMSSSPGAADVYAVEAVPYVQYFHGGFALHSAYWHDRFGFRISHGCVNLSPRDAAHVYSLTGPHARDGWMEVFEDEGDLGTRVRIHEGNEVVADRREPVEHVFG